MGTLNKMWNTLVWFMVIIEFYSPQHWVHKGSYTEKDWIGIPKDKQAGSSTLQAPLQWND